MFSKTKALLLFYLLHYLSFNNSQPNLLLLQEKTAKHTQFHLCVERTDDTNAEESQPCFGVYVPFSSAVFHKARIHSSPTTSDKAWLYSNQVHSYECFFKRLLRSFSQFSASQKYVNLIIPPMENVSI